MARTRTLTLLIADVRQRAGMESSQFVTDAEVTEYINQSISDLYDLIVAARGQEHFVTSATLGAPSPDGRTVSGVDTYALPATFYEMLGVDAQISSDTYSLKPFMFEERNIYKISGGWSPVQPIYYRVQGANIKFIPAPSGTFPVTLWFIPCAVRLVNGGDLFDGYNGWEEFAVVDAAMKCLDKEESDTSQLAARKAELTRRINALAAQRDAGHPERVTDVTVDINRRWIF